MLVSQSVRSVVLTECPDRRSFPRLEHQEAVELDGRTVSGRDISTRGLSVVVPPPVKVGDVVQVRLAGCLDSGKPLLADARVARLEATAQGFVVGLEFVE